MAGVFERVIKILFIQPLVFRPRYDRKLTLAFTRAADRDKWLGKVGIRSAAKQVDAPTNIKKKLVAVKTLKGMALLDLVTGNEVVL